ncbi:hypothetical protein [Actinophytocola sp.]
MTRLRRADLADGLLREPAEERYVGKAMAVITTAVRPSIAKVS